MSYRSKSWVWQYGKRQGDRAFCSLCDDSSNKELSCAGGSTGSFRRHLKVIHNVGRTIQNQSDDNDLEVEESNTIVGITQGSSSSSSSNTLNTGCSSTSEFRELPLKKRRRTFMNKSIEHSNICSSEKTE